MGAVLFTQLLLCQTLFSQYCLLWWVGGVMLEGKERPSFGLGLAVQILIISELCFM